MGLTPRPGPATVPTLTGVETENRTDATRVTKRRAETRARLLEAAMQIFVDRGFGRATIDQICSAAGYTRGAFYSQFDSLDELFFALYDQRAAQVTRQLADVLGTAATDAPVVEQINRAVAAVLLNRSWIMVRTDFLLHAARNPAAADRLIAHRDTLRLAIVDRLEAIGTSARLPPSLADTNSAAAAVMCAYDAAATALLLHGDESTARRVFQQLLIALLQPGSR